MVRHGFWLVGTMVVAVLASSCGGGQQPRVSTASPTSSVVEICPGMGEANAAVSTITASRGQVRISTPPPVFARAHGQSVELAHGESEWCGAVSDVFHVVTSDTPLVVAPGETIGVPNPLPGEHLFNAGIQIMKPSSDPTPATGSLIWPFGPGSGHGHGLRYDDDGLTFVVDGAPGRYVVSVWLNFARRADIFTSSNRSAYYALLIEVKQ